MFRYKRLVYGRRTPQKVRHSARSVCAGQGPQFPSNLRWGECRWLAQGDGAHGLQLGSWDLPPQGVDGSGLPRAWYFQGSVHPDREGRCGSSRWPPSPRFPTPVQVRVEMELPGVPQRTGNC